VGGGLAGPEGTDRRAADLGLHGRDQAGPIAHVREALLDAKHAAAFFCVNGDGSIFR